MIKNEFPFEIYSIAHFEYGINIYGVIPKHILMDIEDVFFKRYNLNVMDENIAHYFNAQYCFTTVEKSILWKEKLGI